MKKAKLIAICGPDQVGKQTQTNLLTRHLRASGYRVALVEVPIISRYASYKTIYWMLHNGMAVKYPNVFQFVHFINKLLFQEYDLRDMMHKYDYIVFDRWKLSSMIYGTCGGASAEFTQRMFDRLVTPDLTIVLDAPAYNVRENDAYEANREFQARVRESYVDWANKDPKTVRVGACAPPFMVHAAIVEKLQENNLL